MSEEEAESQSATHTAASSAASVKNVFIFRNGDVFAPSKKFVLNRRQLRDWDVFLEQVTQSINPMRGAVRAIVTPRRGRRRIQDLDSFDDRGCYVALANGERFKPLGYLSEDGSLGSSRQGTGSPGGSPRKNNGKVQLQPIQPVLHNKKLMNTQSRFYAQADAITAQSKTIRVYRNGDEFTPAIVVLLRPSEQHSMEAVLTAIEERVVLPSNRAIRKLYDLSGYPVTSPNDLQHLQWYVAAAAEPFAHRPYGQRLPLLTVGKLNKRSAVKYLSHPITPDKNATRRGRDEKSQNQMSESLQGTYRISDSQQQGAETQRMEPQHQDSLEDFAGSDGHENNGIDTSENKGQTPVKYDFQHQDYENVAYQQAATKIQAGFRGYRTRKQLAANEFR